MGDLYLFKCYEFIVENKNLLRPNQKTIIAIKPSEDFAAAGFTGGNAIPTQNCRPAITFRKRRIQTRADIVCFLRPWMRTSIALEIELVQCPLKLVTNHSATRYTDYLYLLCICLVLQSWHILEENNSRSSNTRRKLFS